MQLVKIEAFMRTMNWISEGGGSRGRGSGGEIVCWSIVTLIFSNEIHIFFVLFLPFFFFFFFFCPHSKSQKSTVVFECRIMLFGLRFKFDLSLSFLQIIRFDVCHIFLLLFSIAKFNYNNLLCQKTCDHWTDIIDAHVTFATVWSWI